MLQQIGNWSRWLTDLFGMDRDDKDEARSAKPFTLLNALSDLMMLPKDMLLTPSIRKEVLILLLCLALLCSFISSAYIDWPLQVCPTFGLPLLTRILNSFIPDEFCPDPVPAALLQALSTQVFIILCIFTRHIHHQILMVLLRPSIGFGTRLDSKPSVRGSTYRVSAAITCYCLGRSF